MSSCEMAQVRCLDMLDAMLLRRFKRAASSSPVALLLLEEEDAEEDDAEESTARSTDFKAVLDEVPFSSSSSSTAARFLPRPLVCLDAEVAVFFAVDIGGAEEFELLSSVIAPLGGEFDIR